MTLSATILAQLAAAAAIPRTLLRIHLDGGTVYFTNHNVNLTFQGQVYTAFPFTHSDIDTFYGKQLGAVDIELGNADKSMSAYAAYQKFEGRECELWEIYLNDNGSVIDGYPTSDDKRVKFHGFMEPLDPSKKTARIRVVSIFDRTRSYGPWRIFGPRCNLDFCSVRCGRRGGTGMLYGTATAGSTMSLTDSAIPADAYLVTDYWKYATITCLSGTNRGSSRRISGFNSTTKQFSWVNPMPAACDTTTTYVIECDKARATCLRYGNQANFDGFDNQIEAPGSPLLDNHTPLHVMATLDLTFRKKDPLSSTIVIPIVYGTARVPGVCVDEYIASSQGDRLYAVCEGPIDNITAMIVNGVEIPPAQYTVYKGEENQSFVFHGETKYFRRTVIVQTNQGYGSQEYGYVWKTDGTPDDVQFIVRGLKVQAYNADGSTNGAPAWSENAALCILDYELKRMQQPLLAASIDFAAAYDAAAACTAEKWTVNLNLNSQQKEADILERMLTVCRGFFTYENGKQLLNIEQQWIGAVAHSFDDTSSGKTENNIMPDTFSYPKRTVKDAPNCYVVKYRDAEVRDNVALIDGYLAAAATTIPFYRLSGSWVASNSTVYIGGEAISYTSITINGDKTGYFSGCGARLQDYEDGYPVFQGLQTFPERTAKYKDKKNIDEIKRVIDVEIDGLAASTNRQAYRIAEWLCRKSVDGNQLVKLRGRRDSMHLSVGKVVAVTHAWPGYVDKKFRITQKSEAQNTQADYVMEWYDDAFYTDSSPIPPTNIGSTLPNPYAAPDHVTGFDATESGQLSQDGTYVPVFVITFTPPANRLFWDYAEIQINVNNAGWRVYAEDRTGAVIVNGISGSFKQGDSVSLRAVSVSTIQKYADAATAPAETNVCLGKYLPPSYVMNFAAVISGPQVLLSWDHISDVDRWAYTIRLGASWEAGTDLVSEYTGNKYLWTPTTTGALTFWIKAIDTSGIFSANAASEVLTIVPASISTITSQIIDNNILLKWTGVPGTYPIRDYELRKGATYGASTLVGYYDATAAPLFETEAGTYKYWITPRDSNGLLGMSNNISATMAQPPDFELHADVNDFFTGTKTNVVYDPADNVFYAPIDSTESFDTYSAELGGSTMQEFIDAGTYLIEPAETSGSYVKTFDFGTTLSSSNIVVTLLSQMLIGTVTVTPKIETSPDNSAWTTYPDVWTALGLSFRYVKVTLTFAGAGGSNVIKLQNLNIRLNVKKVYDTGSDTVSNAANGKIVQFNKDYVDVISIGVTPKSTSARFAVYDFKDTISSCRTGSTTSIVKVQTGEGTEWAVNDWMRVPLTTGVEYVQVTGISTDDLTVSPALSTAPPENTSLYHSSFTVYIFDSTGTKVTGDFSWDAAGIE